MKRSSLVLVIYLTLVFLSGMLVGAVGYRLYTAESVRAKPRRWSPEEYRLRYMKAMKSRLKLTEDQIQKLNVILDETGKRFTELENRTKPETRAIHEQQVQDINVVLSGEQRAEYEKMRQERAERRKRSKRTEGPPPHRRGGPGHQSAPPPPSPSPPQ